jgi:enamine deaminase RidA (YjgF/YER057c/UK114 family)
MTVEEKLAEMGLTLPPAPKPVGAYVAAVRTGSLVFTSGQLPTLDGTLIAMGKVSSDTSIADAAIGARHAALNAMAAIKAEIGSLDKVCRIVRLNCFVNSAPGFTDQAKVANGASELLTAVFENGAHSRCALGAAELPLNAAVELDVVVEVE